MTHSQRRKYTLGLLIAMSFMSCAILISGVLLNHIIDHYELSDAAQGYASSAASIGGIVALISSLFVMGRLKKDTILMIAIAVTIGGLIMLRFSGPFAMFLIASAVVGMSTGYMDSLLSSNMADLYQGEKATKMMSLLHTTFSAASMLVPVVYTAILSAFAASGISWNNIYLCIAGLGALTFLLYAFLKPRGNQDQDGTVPQAKNEKLSLKTLKSVLKAGVLPGLIIAMILHNVFFHGMITWINRFVGVELEGEMGDIALSFMWLGIMISRLSVPILKINIRRYLWVAGFLAGSVMLIGILIANPIVMCIATAVTGMLFGAMLPCIFSLGCEVTPENTMLATSVLVLAANTGAIVGAPLVGALESAFGMSTGMIAISIFIMLSSTALLLTPRIGLLKRNHKSPQ